MKIGSLDVIPDAVVDVGGLVPVNPTTFPSFQRVNVPWSSNSACSISNLNAFVPSKFGFFAVSLTESVPLPASLPAFTFAEELAG